MRGNSTLGAPTPARRRSSDTGDAATPRAPVHLPAPAHLNAAPACPNARSPGSCTEHKLACAKSSSIEGPSSQKFVERRKKKKGVPEFVFCAGPGKLFLASTSAPCRCDGGVRAASGLCRGTCGARAAFTRVLLSVPRVWERPDPGLVSWIGDAGSGFEQRTWRGDAAPVGCHAAGSGSKPAVRRTRRG